MHSLLHLVQLEIPDLCIHRVLLPRFLQIGIWFLVRQLGMHHAIRLSIRQFGLDDGLIHDYNLIMKNANRTHLFNVKLELQKIILHTPMYPMVIQFVLRLPNYNIITTKPQTLTAKTNPLTESFFFDCQLKYKRVKQAQFYQQNHVEIKLIGIKSKQSFQLGVCKLDLAALANYNQFYYENQFQTQLSQSQYSKIELVFTIKINNLSTQDIFHGSNGLSHNSLTSKQSGNSHGNNQVIAVSTKKVVIGDLNKKISTHTFSENQDNLLIDSSKSTQFHEQKEIQENNMLRRKLQQLYNKLGNQSEQQQRNQFLQGTTEQPSQAQLKQLRQAIKDTMISNNPQSSPVAKSDRQCQTILEEKVESDIESMIQENLLASQNYPKLQKQYERLWNSHKILQNTNDTLQREIRRLESILRDHGIKYSSE